MTALQVKLTLAQADAVEWALGAMDDYWTSESEAEARDGEVIDEALLPVLQPHKQTSRLLTLSPLEEVNEDLLYRLEEQAPDMAGQALGWGDSEQALAGNAQAARNAAKRIRHQMKYGN